MPAFRSGLRLAELVTAISLATDLGSGVPMQMMLATCLAGLRLGEALRLITDELRDIYYLTLLRHAGLSPSALTLVPGSAADGKHRT
jgi:hypothetical protein